MLNEKSNNNIIPAWSLNKIDDFLSITTIKGIDKGFLLALQVNIFAVDNSGIGHLLEHIIVNKTRELTQKTTSLKDDYFITGVTYPNYVVFYIGAESHEKFNLVLEAFLEVYSSISGCEKIYTSLVDDISDYNSIISELIRREKDRISVIWQNFYEKRFANTKYRFNSGGHSTMLKSKSFEEVELFWKENCFSNVEIVMCAEGFEDKIKTKLLELRNSCGTKFNKSKMKSEKSIIPISYNRYKTKYDSSFSCGIGIVNKKGIGTDYLESLLFNVVINNDKVKKGLDFLYENATPYGMFYFGIHSKKKNDKVNVEFFFDLLMKIVLEVDENFVKKVSRDITKRLQVLELDYRQKSLELSARILQRFRRDQNLDESIVLPGKYAAFDGRQLKRELIDFVKSFADDADNNRILFCYQ